MLHTPIVDRKGKVYCGPTAVAAITGMPLSKVEKMLRRVRNEGQADMIGGKTPRKSKAVRGIYNTELVKVLGRAGYKVTHHAGGMTLGALLDDRGHMGYHVVHYAHHYVSFARGQIIDNGTLVPVDFGSFGRRAKRVKNFWEIS